MSSVGAQARIRTSLPLRVLADGVEVPVSHPGRRFDRICDPAGKVLHTCNKQRTASGLDRGGRLLCTERLFRKHQAFNFFSWHSKFVSPRIGTTHQPHYRVVVAEARSRRDGAPTEVLGTYDPRSKGNGVKLNLDRVDYWLSKGAKPSDTLHSMIKRARRAAPAAAAPSA